MKKYEAYKSSGIEWIGEIPEGWAVIPMKHYFYMKGRIGWQGLKADEFLEDGPYLVTGTDFENGKVCWERCYHISEERYNEAPEIHVETGDLLITKDGTVGKLALIEEKPEKVSLNSHLLILRPTKENVNNKFVYWALQSVNFKDYTGLASSGSTMASLSQEKIGAYPLILPSLSEQQAIASYLDHKVGQIDASVSAINTQIDDLKAYRQSIISEAVTKGLNPNAPMKNSGIEWIGEIPEGWELPKLKWIVSLKSGSSLTSNSIQEEGLYKVYGGNGFRGYYNEYTNDGFYALIGRQGALCGNINYARGKFWATEHAVVCYPKQEVDTFWLGEMLRAMNLNQYSLSAAQPGLAVERINELRIPLPPLIEQQAIASYLDSKTSKIDATIASLELQRDDLNALKQSVISEAVTGKIDVREWKKD